MVLRPRLATGLLLSPARKRNRAVPLDHDLVCPKTTRLANWTLLV